MSKNSVSLFINTEISCLLSGSIFWYVYVKEKGEYLKVDVLIKYIEKKVPLRKSFKKKTCTIKLRDSTLVEVKY